MQRVLALAGACAPLRWRQRRRCLCSWRCDSSRHPFTIVILSAPHRVLAGTNVVGARRTPIACPRACANRQRQIGADLPVILPYVTGVLRAPLYECACERSMGCAEDDMSGGARRPRPEHLPYGSYLRKSARICVICGQNQISPVTDLRLNRTPVHLLRIVPQRCKAR